MHNFASGRKRNYYGKADVIAYRLNRDGLAPPGALPVFGANVTLLIYGDSFWPTYETGDNTGLIATDSMKNFIQRETLNFPGYDLESYCRFLAARFLETYPHVEGAQITATAIPYQPIAGGNVAFAPSGPEAPTARLELRRSGATLETVELCSGIQGFRLLRLGGSAFHGFVRDQYTTLPDIHNRPLHMWLTLDWTYTDPAAGYSDGAVTAQVRRLVHEVFHGFESGSIQQIIYQIGRDMLARVPEIVEVNLEGQNRTWDTVAESGDTIAVYTEARPPYGCLGLTLRR
jgi:urate oxidase / 2-oxo-4-hydroxy-4-carboxy-5-ureidoimidazoline decarboxylase